MVRGIYGAPSLFVSVFGLKLYGSLCTVLNMKSGRVYFDKHKFVEADITFGSEIPKQRCVDFIGLNFRETFAEIWTLIFCYEM